MRKQRAVLLSAVLLVVGLAAVAVAQDETKYAKCEVPFAFMAGTVQMPAGQYWIRTTDAGVVEIGTLDNRHVLALETKDVLLPGAAAESKLLFKQYGDKIFLARVLRQGDRIASDIQESRAQRQLARAAQAKPVEVLTDKDHK